MGDVVLGPQTFHQLHMLDSAAAAMLVFDADGFVIAFTTAEPETESNPAVRNEIQGRYDLSELAWMAQVAEEHGSAQADSLGHAGSGGQYR